MPMTFPALMYLILVLDQAGSSNAGRTMNSSPVGDLSADLYARQFAIAHHMYDTNL